MIVTFTKGILFDLDDFSFRRYNQGDRVAGIAKIKEDEVYCVRIEEDFLPSIFLNYFRLSQKGSIARA